MRIDEATWAEIRHLYEHTRLRVVEIALRFDVDRATINRRAKAEAWAARPLSPEVAKRRAGAQAWKDYQQAAATTDVAKPPRRHKPDRREVRRARVKRLLDLQLDNLETQLMSGEPILPQDAMRITRQLSAVTSTAEKLNTENERPTVADKQPQGAGSSDRHLKAEKLRRDIAQRLERLNAQWNALSKPE